MVLPLPPIFGDRDQLGHVVHLHGAIAHQRDHGTIRIGIFGRNRIGHRGSHRRQSSRKRSFHSVAHLQIARKPIGAGAGIAGNDRAFRQSR